MSKILLCQTSNTRLPNLEAALIRKDHQVVAKLDLINVSSFAKIPGLEQIDLAIIDASCGYDGTSCCKAFNRAYPNIPIILLVAEGTQVAREYRTLTGGNVLQMPFTPRKVTNRIKKITSCRQGNIVIAGQLSLNIDKRCVYRRDIVHRLTPRQAKLLEVFMRHTGQTLTRKFLMEQVWETDYMGDTRTLDVHVRWIRERIEEDPGSPQYLRTVRGIGYRFGVPSEEDTTS